MDRHAGKLVNVAYAAGLTLLFAVAAMLFVALSLPSMVAAFADDRNAVEVIDPASIGIGEHFITPRTRQNDGEVGSFMRSVVSAPDSQWFGQSIRTPNSVTTAERPQ